MNLSKDKQRVYCHECCFWQNIYTDVKAEGDNILCLDCNAHLGYIWDLPELYMPKGDCSCDTDKG